MKNFFLSCREFHVEPSSPPLYYGSFYVGPFENGQALTVANALRRTLLSEISGLGITALKMDGVSHEYSNLPGLRENVLEVLLNFKEIVLKKTKFEPLTQTQIGYLQARGPGIVRAGDLQLPPMIQCVDPDQYICTLNHEGYLNIVFTIEEGKNFLFRKEKSDFFVQNFTNLSFPVRPEIASSEKSSQKEPTAILPIDPVFSPIKRVNYSIQAYSSESIYKYNQFVILEIWTNGSVSPRDSLTQTLNFLRFVFSELGKLEVLNSISNGYLLSENPEMRESFGDLKLDLDFMEYSLYKKKLFLDTYKAQQQKRGDLEAQLSLKTANVLEKNIFPPSEEASITELGLPFPMFKAFYKAKIHKIKNLLELTKPELQEILNFDENGLTVLMQKLEEKNLNLTPS